MSKDLDEVTRLLNLYIEGAGKGNADKLNEAFHASARWFGTMGGVDYDVDKAGFVALMVESPGDAGNMTAEITDIQIDGTVAMATIKETGFWGTLSFTDYFTLSVLEGKWQITNKTFAHTGGEHAQKLINLKSLTKNLAVLQEILELLGVRYQGIHFEALQPASLNLIVVLV